MKRKRRNLSVETIVPEAKVLSTKKSMKKRQQVSRSTSSIGSNPVTIHNPMSKPETSSSFIDRMNSKLKSARFRCINESLYTKSGSEARQMINDNPETFSIYHEGYELQKKQWPVDPLDLIIQQIKNLPKDKVVADMGCGGGRLAESIRNQVHSFDLAAVNDRVIACDMAHTPLVDEAVDICVFCLSLMGTNLIDYLIEANRILRPRGVLKIVEITSRFSSIRQFRRSLEKLGFQFLKKMSVGEDDYFVQLDFEKTGKPKQKRLAGLTLNPCLYKKR